MRASAFSGFFPFLLCPLPFCDAQAASLSAEAMEGIANNTAKEYVTQMVTRCGDSWFVKEGRNIWEFKGTFNAFGCHEPPERNGFNGVSWSCGIEVSASKARVHSPNSGWTEWDDPPPFLIGVLQRDKAWKAHPGQLAKISCNEISSNSDRRVGKTKAATVNAPRDGFLALRSEPSTRRGVRLQKIPHGTKVQLGPCKTNADGDTWCQTTYLGRTGWILDRYVLR